MQDLNDLYFFAMVVEKGGFAAAGRALSIPKSRLSRRIAQLEERLGVRLLQRSTRRFVVTEVGQNFYRHCQAVIAEAQAAQEAVEQLRVEPRGIVRVSCPVSIAQSMLAPILPRFLQAHAQVRVQLLVSNRRVDLINESVDVAIRVRTALDMDPNLVSRSFGRGRLLLVASRSYLDAHKRPQQPADLATLVTLSNVEQEGTQTWELIGPNEQKVKVEHQPRLMCGDFGVIAEAAIAGLGVGLLPERECCAGVASGALEIVLPDWNLPEGIVHAVFPTRRGLLPAVRAFIDFLAEHLPGMVESHSVSGCRAGSEAPH